MIGRLTFGLAHLNIRDSFHSGFSTDHYEENER